jgi:hypothetical protein
MNNLDNFLVLLSMRSKVSDFDDLDPEFEKEEISAINEKLESISESLGVSREVFHMIYRVVHEIDYLNKITKMIDHPVHMNVFNDKYGNKFIQARTSLRDKYGKLVSINAYVGSVKKFEKGENDPRAISLGKALVRKKMKKYFLS